MKKITLVIFAFLLSFNAFAQFPEGFEGTWTAGSGPAGWTILNNAPGLSQFWRPVLQTDGTTTYPPHSGTNAAYINRETVGVGLTTDDWLITPEFTVPANGQLTFWSRLTIDGDQGTIYKIFIGNSTTDITQFTELQSWSETELNVSQQEYEEKRVNIPASYVGQSLRIAFVMRGRTGDRWVIDDVNVVSQCLAPTLLGIVGNPTTTTADLTWTENNGATSWEIEVQPLSGTQTQSGQVYSGDLPYQATNLSPSTTYQYWVRSRCQSDGTNNSVWAGPFTFTTQQEPAQLNWFTDFEAANNPSFTLVNGTQTNKWAIGTAVSNSPTTSLYISTDGGITNFYTNTSSSVVHAYRDVFIPAGAGEVMFNYDWKGIGESGADYLRVWSTPQSYNPVAGIQTTAVNSNYINHSGNLVGTSVTAWTTATHNLDVSAYAGTVRRFIFEWTNNSSGGLQPPAAIDNVIFTLISCPQPTNLTAAVNINDAVLSWTQPGTATQWEVYAVPASAAAPTPATTGEIVNGTPTYTYTGLTAGSSYKYYVRARCSDTDISVWSGPYTFNSQLCNAVDQCSYTFNLTDSFGDGWNGGIMEVRQNTTVIATLTLTGNTSSGSQTVTVCNNTPLSLVWTTAGSFPGEMGISIVNNFGQTIFTKAAGTGSANSTLFTTTVDCATPLCLAPTALNVTNVGQENATLVWGNGGAGSFEYYLVPTGTAAPTATTDGVDVSTSTVPVTGLTASTTYDYYVRMICNNGASVSPWSTVFTFTTTQIPAQLNYSDTFEGPLTWTAVNGNQTNKWVYGTAVSNSPTHSLYVSNTNGTTHAYNNGASSVVHAYRDIAIPTGATDINIAFDWLNLGEGGSTIIWDYITVFAVPTSYSPTPGTNMLNANLNGGEQITTTRLWNQTTWQRFNRIYNAAAYAGGTMRLVFQWVNDGSGGTNPPGAIDNVEITRITCPQPTVLAVPPATINQNSAVITWTPGGTETSWEVIVQPATAPAPTAASTGVVVNNTPSYTAPNLDAATLYVAYVRAVCSDTDKSLWSGPVSFNTPICDPANQCNYTFILRDSASDGWNGNTMSVRQNGIVVGTLNLTSGAGPVTVTVPLCNGVGFDLFWNASGSWATEVQVDVVDPFGETLFSHPGGTNLQNTVLYSGVANCTPPPCTRPNGLVINCLTSEGINVTWNDPGNIAQWEVVVQPASSPAPTSGTVVNVPNYTYEGAIQQGVAYTVFVRAICPDGSGFSTWATLNFTGPYISVGEAQALCAGILGVSQPSNSGGTLPTYGTVGCLGSTPNPTWYYVTLGADGAVSLNLAQVRDSNGQGIDVDFAMFGPFDSKLEACALLGTPPSTQYLVDCSFSAAAVEQIDFTGNAGDVFALLVTNFNGSPGHITITQTSGPAISCNPTVELGPSRSYCDTASYNLTATVDNPGAVQVYTYTWFKDTQPYTPTIVGTTADSQTIEVTDAGSHVYTVVVTVPNPTSADPITDTTTITLSHPWTAPVYDPINVCSTATTADVNININYLGTLLPADYTLVGVYATALEASQASTPGIDVSALYTTGTTTLYAVVADVLVPTCKKTIPLQINVSQTSGTLNYAPQICSADATALPGLVQTGGVPGTYVATPEGLVIDGTTGIITPSASTPGTYHIVYTIPAEGTCAEVLVEDDVEILLTPSATIDYPGAYCNTAGTTAVVELTGTTGGTFSGDTGLVIDPATGAVDLGASTPGLHEVTYTIPANGICTAAPVTANIEINAQLSGTFDYPRNQYCTNEGMVSVTNFVGSINGTYIATPDGLAIDPATGEIDLAASAPGTYDIVYHFDATASCAAYTSPAFQLTVNLLPVTTVTYDGPYCNTPGVIGSATIAGTQGGTFSGDTGLFVDPTTGVIDLGTSSPGLHAVTYTPPATGVCVEPAVVVSVEINAQLTGTFDYPRAAYCTSEGTASVTNFVGSSGGMYMATPAGLVIDPATGEIDLAASTAGVYDIVYHFDATSSCLEYTSPVFQLTVVEQPVTTIDYGTTPFCNTAGFTAPVTLTGTTGGVFTATPAGLTIDPATGEIDLGTSAPNTYTISYAPPATGPCTEAPVTATVVINSSLSTTLTYPAAAFCTDGGTATPTATGDTGGSYEVTPATGLTIDPATGIITLATSTAGQYSIVYHIPAAGACGDFFSVPVVIDVYAAPDAATVISYPAAVFCSNAGLIPATITGTTGGSFNVVETGLVMNAATGEIDTAASAPGVYSITYTTPATAPCLPVTTPVVTITINELPTVSIAYPGSPYCSNEGMATVQITGTGAYTNGRYSSAAGLRINAVTGEVDLALSDPGTYDVIYTVTGPAGCGVITSAPASVVITRLPEPDFTYATLVTCNASGQPLLTPSYLSANGVAGNFTVNQTGLNIDPATGIIDPVSSAPGIYVITNTITGVDGCAGNNPASAPVTVQITPAPVADFSYSALAYCQASTTTVSPSLTGVAGTFTSTPDGLVINSTNGTIDVAASTPGIYEIVNSVDATATCPEVISTPVYVTITAQPIINTTNGCVDNKYTLQVYFDADPVYSADDVDIVWTATSPTGTTVGTTEAVVITTPGDYFVTVTPKTGAVCSAVLPISVASTMCNIQKGISPGGTMGQNDDFDLSGLDVRKISIYNRYGKEVYKFEGEYTNQWHGQTSGNEELPTGTYFYTFVRANGEVTTQWIYLNREVK